MIYLLIGEDTALKDEKILQIKSQNFPASNADSALFDFDSLSGHKLDSDILKKSLMALPVLASKRLVVVRDCHKLTDACKETISNFTKVKQDNVIVVLDFGENEMKAFATKLRPLAKVLEFPTPKKMNVFDMTKLMASDPAGALKILNELFEQGDHPLQVMGGLVWFWGKEKMRLKSDKYNKGLLVLQEADVNIKRSRLDPQHAVEVLVIKLSSLLAY